MTNLYNIEPYDLPEIRECKDVLAMRDFQIPSRKHLEASIEDRSNWIGALFKAHDGLMDAIHLLENGHNDDDLNTLRAILSDITQQLNTGSQYPAIVPESLRKEVV